MEKSDETILIVDDMQANLTILAGILKDRYHIKLAKSGTRALEIISNGGVDLVLLDVVMPDMDGYEVCKIVKNDPKLKDIPIIFVTGNTSKEDEERGFELGAVDYIAKPFNPSTVRARVNAHINLRLRQVELETLSKKMQEQNEKLIRYTKEIERISVTDGLTDIFNRRHFNEIFPKILNSAKRNDDLVSFLLMDIDYFKQYNDNYGHQAGDSVLIKLAKCLKDSLHRADDIPFRLGGEEFGIVFKSDSKEKALEFANTILTNIENLKLKHQYSSASSYVTASMGLLCKRASKIKDMDEAYKECDDLLYEAKEGGRNQIRTNSSIDE